MKSLRTPEPGGLRYREVLALLRAAADRKRIPGFDVVELAPIEGEQVSEFTVAKVTAKLIARLLRDR